MKTLLFCTAYIPDERAWRQRYEPWLAHHRVSKIAPDAIVMIDDHSPFVPTSLTALPASRIGQDALPAESILRFEQRLGRPRTMDFPGWYRGMFASVSLALHYGFERIVHVESDSFILSERLASYLAGCTTGWTALWCPEFNCPESAIQVLCRDAFDLIDALAAQGPFAFRDKPAELTLPFTNVDKSFIGDRYNEFKCVVPANADYSVQNDPAESPLKPDAIAELPAAPFEATPSAHASADQLASCNGRQQLHELFVTFPYDAEVACQYGISAYQEGDFLVARAALERSDWLRPENGLTCKFLGAARMQQSEVAGAAAAAVQSARLNPNDADAQNMAGAFNLQAGKVVEAIGYLRAALALEPDASSALSNLAHIDWSEPLVAEKYPAGMRGIDQEVRAALLERLSANRLTPNGAAALLSYGVHFPESFGLLLQLAHALIADTGSDAQTLFTAGNALLVAGDAAGALAAYRRAALLAPDSDRIKSAVGYASICRGGKSFSEGFRIANDSWPNLNPTAFIANPKRWNGEHTGKKLLIYQEQGIGDALICLRLLPRLLPLLKQHSIDATVWFRPELAALVSDQCGLPFLKSAELPDAEQSGFDSTISLFGLIDVLATTAEQIPPPLTIKPSAASVTRFAEKLSSLKHLRVGLCLFGNPTRVDDWVRSVDATDVAVLAHLQDVDWINLSVDARPERDSLERLLPNFVDLSIEMTDFEASAAMIANLDVVVTIDCVIAHLAAALDKPVLLLRPSIADWRWRIGEVDSPWWPTVEIFACEKPGEFAAAIGAVAAHIRKLVADRR